MHCPIPESAVPTLLFPSSPVAALVISGCLLGVTPWVLKNGGEGGVGRTVHCVHYSEISSEVVKVYQFSMRAYLPISR